MLKTLIDAGRQSCAAARARISNVRWCDQGISFDLDGVPHTGVMRGSNADLLLGYGSEIDASVALRVLLAGDATPVAHPATLACPVQPGEEEET